MYRVWYSTESFADYIIDNTDLKNKDIQKQKLYESDANNSKNFHTVPDHIKKILYLDCPDLIVEKNSEPIFSIEISKEAGTGHNIFQRFARIAASVENNVPAFYIYPEAVIITRKDTPPKWDKINPLIFKALDAAMSIYDIPALYFYFPSDYRAYSNAELSPNQNQKGLNINSDFKYLDCPIIDEEMSKMFDCINVIISTVETEGVIDGKKNIIKKQTIRQRRSYMNDEYSKSGNSLNTSPITATVKIPTKYLLNYLSKYEKTNYSIGELLHSREETILYCADAKFRGDPYPGSLAAIDYLLCREGKSFEERKYNLILLWGTVEIDDINKTIKITDKANKNITINDFVTTVNSSENKNILSKSYSTLTSDEIPRFYMQVRYGSTYSKAKHIRVYSYFADAILFPDGALWRDA